MALAPQLSTWVTRREQRRRARLRALTASVALSGLGALCVDALLYLPLLVVVPVGFYLTAEWCWWRTWADRCDRRGNPRIRAALPRAVVERPTRPRLVPGQRLPDSDVLVPGFLTVAGDEWRWHANRLVNPGIGSVSWRSGDVLTPTVTRSWGPGLPPAGYLTFVSPGGSPVTAVVAEPDRTQVLLDRHRRDRAWWD
ncbi:hypothetical protein ACIB24_06965 [Spongisporangium articulatum]|uniref:Uncharacterized protein n=1 Tax=Spongisporangium articulatum TaxID=3362603 RepID=A0ABW8AK96_9ACTN